MSLRVAERKAEMASTSSGPDAQATHVMGNDDSAENYPNGMSSDAGGFEAESPQAKQIRAKALWHAREAQRARAEYTRLVSPGAGVPNWNPHNKMQPESLTSMMAAQADFIGRTQASLAFTRIVDQIRNEFLDGYLKNEDENAVARALVSGLVTYAPLVVLGSSRREGKSFVSDAKVWSVGAIAVVTLADAFRGKIAKILKDLDERRERAVEGAKEGNAKPAEMDDSARRLVEEFTGMVEELSEKIKTAAPARESSP
jgi:hypothetical protein